MVFLLVFNLHFLTMAQHYRHAWRYRSRCLVSHTTFPNLAPMTQHHMAGLPSDKYSCLPKCRSISALYIVPSVQIVDNVFCRSSPIVYWNCTRGLRIAIISIDGVWSPLVRARCRVPMDPKSGINSSMVRFKVDLFEVIPKWAAEQETRYDGLVIRSYLIPI